MYYMRKNVCNIMVLPEDRSGAVDGGVAVRFRARHYNIILLYDYCIRTCVTIALQYNTTQVPANKSKQKRDNNAVVGWR